MTLGSPLSREVDFSSFFRRALMGSWPGASQGQSLTPQTDNLQREPETCDPRAVGGRGHNSGSHQSWVRDLEMGSGHSATLAPADMAAFVSAFEDFSR